MPELSPKQLAVWLLIAALILFIGARGLRGEKATKIDPGQARAATAATAESRSGGGGAGGELELVDDATPAPSGSATEQPLYVHVAGAVRRPGLYRLSPGDRIADAVRRAGGATGRADLDRINLAATVADGQQVLVPRRGDPADAAGAGSGPVDAAAADGGPETPISLSTATAAELETIDGIGPVTAAKILDFRESEGPIDSIEQLDAVSGIGPATMQTLRQALVP